VAIDALRNARVSPEPTAAFFDTLGKGEAGGGGILAYVASHPAARDRATRFRQSATRAPDATPVLDARQWAALQRICRGTTATIDWNF
jgi:predicted Zn-dependent protease